MVTDNKKELAEKKVCIIRSNPVRPDSRVEKEAWTLKKAGYDVHILAWDRDTNIYETEDFIDVANVKIPITRLGHKASFGEGLKNLRPYLAFQFHMRKWLKNNTFDVIHACDFDTAFFSLSIAKEKSIKFVFDIFDFIFGDPQNFAQKLVKKAQLQIIDRADATIICTEERKLQIKGSIPKQLAVIHNTPDISQIDSENFSLEKSDKIRIVYVGILQDYRLLKEIAEVIANSDKFELHIGGFGKYHSYFSQLDATCENIFFYGKLNYKQTLALERECDIMLAVYDPSVENHRFAAPNKFYESLMLGKPVVMAKGTGMSRIVEQNNLGVLIDYSKEGFYHGINELLKIKPQWESIEQRMKNIYEKEYCWSEMEKRLLELYAGIIDEENTDC